MNIATVNASTESKYWRRTLKTRMNHASIQQTSEYVATNDEMLKQAIRGI